MQIDILSDFKFPKQYWAVGSSYGGTDDQTQKFLANSQWIEGWGALNDRTNENILSNVNIDDVLVMKSSATKGKNHAITFTRVKAIGIVKEKINFYTFKVKWYNSKKFPLDFDGIRYSKTIELLRNDDLLKYVTEFSNKLNF